jgi:hypothetical protein
LEGTCDSAALVFAVPEGYAITDKKALTFNAAGLNEATVDGFISTMTINGVYATQNYANEENLSIAYIVEGEFVDNLQTSPGVRAFGKKEMLSFRYGKNQFDRHYMEEVFKGLERLHWIW